VLLAGGSSSGKTTTATRICTQLMVDDRAAVQLSTDDYFVGDDVNPRNPDGTLDYEHVECVDIPQLAADVNALLRGDAVKRRRFDFVNHVPVFTDEPLSLRKGGFVVLEGIHALNPRLTDGIDDGCKFRVFVEPKPTLDVFAGITPRPTDIRFLRRMVRQGRAERSEATVGTSQGERTAATWRRKRKRPPRTAAPVCISIPAGTPPSVRIYGMKNEWETCVHLPAR
jgi:uridine kinase